MYTYIYLCTYIHIYVNVCISSSKMSFEIFEKEVQYPVTSDRLKGYFCSDSF